MKRHRRKVVLLAITFSLFRIGLSFASNPALDLNVDEERSWQIAENHAAGRGYVYFDPYVNDYVPTSLQNSTTVFIYEFLVAGGISRAAWVAAVYVITAIVLGVSIWTFYLLAGLLLAEGASLAATFLYCILPTSLYWVSRIFYYENLVVPLLVITVFVMLRSLKDAASRLAWLLPLTVIVCLALRTQVLPVLVLLLAAFALIAVIRRRFALLAPVAAAIIGCIAITIPALVKNHGIFGVYSGDNLAGYAMLDGHNPHARGGWNQTWRQPGDPQYEYAHANIPALDSMNEYEESQARRQLALKFIKENPLQDLRIEVKKLALFFAPFDYPGTAPIFDPILLFINVPFLAMMLIRVWRRDFTEADALLLAPIVGSLAITIAFFMGVRWRYYAEPFMIIYAVMFLDLVVRRFRPEGSARPLPA